MVCEPCQKSLASFWMLVSSWSIANDWNEDDEMKEDNDFGAIEVKKEDVDISDSNTNSSSVADISDSAKILKKPKANNEQVTKIKTENDEVSDSSESASVISKDIKKEDNEEDVDMQDLQLKNEEVDIKDEDG